MNRILASFFLAFLAVLCVPVSAQFYNVGGFGGGGFGEGQLGSPGFSSPKSVSVSTYVGPGDITFNGSAANVKEIWSCARAVNTAHASTSTSLCDLVDSSAPTVVICTLRASITGFVDQTAYCPGSVTPAAKCAAATGGVCNISNAYGQIGGIGNAVNVVAATQPVLAFASPASGTLPTIKCTAANCVLVAGSAFTLAQPFVMSAAYIRNPTSAAQGQIVGGGTSTTLLMSSPISTANRFGCTSSASAFVVATDVIWHGGISLFNSPGGATTSIINLDGSNTSSENCGTGTFSAEGIRLFRGPSGANQMDGSVAEAMIVGSTASTSDFTNLFNNMNSAANGYNGGL